MGSVFKNPPGMKAYQVIERLGFRGKRRGGAIVSWKHPNFILNMSGASAEDIFVLIREIQEASRRELSINLEPEIIFLGEFSDYMEV